jgi:selenocysteine lyase/cysteine desulfurase
VPSPTGSAPRSTASPELGPAGWRDAFDADPGYLDTATMGVPPRVAADALDATVAGWRRGRLDAAGFDEYVTRARVAWARLCGVTPGDVAVGSTVSAFVGLVAAALPEGGTVLVAKGDFTSVLFPLLAQQGRGVRVREVPLGELIAAVDDGIDLVAVSAVQSADGRVLDVGELRQAAGAHGVRVLLDVTQAAGWLPLDVSAIDYVVCSGYKWLLAPRGVAFLAVRPDRRDSLTPHSAGWYAGQDVWASIYGSPLRLAGDARRFDISPAWFCWVGAAYSLELLAGIGVDAIHAHDRALADAFRQGLGLPPGDSAIVSLSLSDEQAGRLRQVARLASRAGRARASFHLYNSPDDVQRAVAALTGEA